MCGINGFTTNGDTQVLMNKMNDATRHRGPDGMGVWSDEYVTLGQNLLAITETPQCAKQPYVSNDGNYVMVYNGEIYNYQELRKALEQEQITFQTNGDTEVVFAGLIKHGPKYLAMLDGMFALAFYDKRAKKLLLARDPAGMKPLYYYVATSNGVVFSSEMRGLFAYGVKPILNIDAAKLFFLFGYTLTEDTLIRGIKKLAPGAYLEIDCVSGVRRQEWFGWGDRVETNAVVDAVMLRRTIGNAVNRHTMGLRPFGLFLSGGLDSTIILHELAERERGIVRTYTTRFATKDPRYNEDADLAARLAGDYHINHQELLVTERAFIEHYDDAILAMEEPRYNPSVPAYWLLAEMASRDITIVLNGSGGDELFLGYPKYVDAANIGAKYAKYPPSLLDLFFSLRAYCTGMVAPGRLLHLANILERWSYVNNITPPARNPALRFMEGFDLTSAIQILSRADIPPMHAMLADPVNAIAELDRWFWLANEDFMRTDKIVMHFGMEGRFPLLAREIVRYANGIASAAKLRHGKKSLLRDAYKGRLPDYIMNKGKTGWNAPIAEWMSGAFGRMVRDILSEGYYRPTSALFDFMALHKHSLNGNTEFSKQDLTHFLPIVQFQVWARAFHVTL